MDDDQLRAVAATRPGYATYPDTRPGSPSWWRRPMPDRPTPARTITREDLAQLADRIGVRLEPWELDVADQVLRMPPPAAAERVRWWRRAARWLGMAR
ncbi:hypothetical protein [Micromonospora haikouensis]|uniref:hypothetical protein n=1 Tax=Micromonospora haikouensis TaxID=686309 RepID=UPI003D74F948